MVDTVSNVVASVLGSPTQLIGGWWLALVAVLFGAYESWWRRWFGGGNFIPKWMKWLKWLDSSRFVKHCLNVVMLFAVCFFVRGISVWWSIYATLVLQLLFWTDTFGMYFDIGRTGLPKSEYDVEEYNKSWFAPILNRVFAEKKWYTDYYDYVGMFIRFTGPLFLLFFVPTFNSGLLFLGTIVSMAYGLSWVLFEKGKLSIWPTDAAEYMSGFFTGVYWVVSV